MKNLSRRILLKVAGLYSLVGVGGCDFQLKNPCRPGPLPAHLAEHPLLQKAWQGIDPARLCDVHVHLAGTGDDPDSGIWIHPHMQSIFHPRRYITMRSLLNASCVDPDQVDLSFVQSMLRWAEAFPAGVKLAIMAFDHYYDESGNAVPSKGAFHVPNSTAARLAQTYPHRFLWLASIHPYRRDAIEALEQAAKDGARGVKWLPQAMGMDPGSPRCDPFYHTMARLKMPLLCHVGKESAVPGAGSDSLANPLLLRRPLRLGVTVIGAHCASDGESQDLDLGWNGPMVSSFDLFMRLLDEIEFASLLFGDISAIVLRNRPPELLRRLLSRPDLHSRLLYGSDHPLPGVMPLIDLGNLRVGQLITVEEEEYLCQVREYNPLLFNFLLMRFLAHDGQRFSPAVFDTRRVI